MDRRSLLDGDMTPTQENPNIFDDEFEVEDFDITADGFRPGQSHDREGSERQDLLGEEEQPVRSVSARYASIPVSSAGPSRNSTRKSRGRGNPFASPEDDGAPLERTPSGNFAPASQVRRSVSSTSSQQYAGASTPRFGAAGPSHPYSMYPQGTIARTPSAATTSTARPTRRSSTRYAPAPQHPYALYPQGVGEDLDDEHEAAQNPVPVGFLGLGQSYQRRRGPDGEEVDILGDYGHTEQLPPYTRYPEDGPEKPLLDVPSPPTELHSRAPVLGTDPGMDLMHTQIRPEQQSMTDESNLARQNSTMSRVSGSPSSAAASSPQDSLLPEKTWAQKSWRERRSTKVCGVPCRWLLVLFGLIFFGLVVMGGVMGGYLAGKKSGESAAYRESSSLYDASLITGSSGVPPPTGTYPLSLGLPHQTQAACLENHADRSAWSCDLVDEAQIDLVIGKPASSGECGAWLQTYGADTKRLYYGSQIKNMDTKYAQFQYVHDNDARQKGPAFYFQQTYNKLVVVPENGIDTSSKKLKRDLDLRPGWTMEKQYASTGDKPWFCYWNDTLLEGFIFTKEKAAPTTSSTKSKVSTKNPSTTSPPTAKPTSYRHDEYSHTMPWSITGAQPSETVSTVLTMSAASSTTSCTYSGVASNFPQWMHENYPEWLEYKDGDIMKSDGDGDGDGDGHRGDNKPPGSSKRNVARGMHDTRDHDSDSNVFEYLVKIEERRCPDSNPPVCVQYQVLNNGEWYFVPDSNGGQITVTLQESDPPYTAYQHSGSSKSKQKRAVPGGCHCEWLSGPG